MNRFKILFLAFFVSGCSVSHNVMVSGKLQNVQVLSTRVFRLVNLSVRPMTNETKPRLVDLRGKSLSNGSPRYNLHKTLYSNAELIRFRAKAISKTKSDTSKIAGNIKPAKIKRKNHDFWWQFAMVLWLNINVITFFIASLSPGLLGGIIPLVLFFLAFFFLMLSSDTVINYNNRLKQTPWELKKVSHNVLKVSRVASIITGALFFLLVFVASDYAISIFFAWLLCMASTLILSQIYLVPRKFDYHKMINRDPEFIEWNRNRIIRLLGAIIAIFFGLTGLSILSLGSTNEGPLPLPSFYSSLSTVFIWALPVGLLLLAYGVWLSVRKPANPERLKKYPALKWARRLFWIGFFSLIFFALILWLSFALFSYPGLYPFYPSPLYYLAIAAGIGPIFLWIAVLILLIISTVEIYRDSRKDRQKTGLEK